jgi:hypothetical protein
MGGTHKKCFYEGCGLIASFGFCKMTGTKYCSKHKEDGMVNLLCKLCQCGTARPTYNYEGLSANFCKLCKKDGMINVNDKNCIGCDKVIPTFNYNGLKAKYCAKCKLEGMINVINEPCVCGKASRPSFNYEGLRPKYCSKCKDDGMINVTQKACQCGRAQPSFNYKGLKPKYCVKCKLDGMEQIRKRFCLVCEQNQANYNHFGEKPKYCGFCKEPDMINIANKCKNKICTGSARFNLDYYCTHCFVNLFPSDERVLQIKTKSKENTVRDFINMYYEGFVHDTCLWTGNCDCSHRRRIDFRKLFGNTLLCIEVDENQHKSYDNADEEIRYDDLYMVFSGKFIFIRFNPDDFRDKNGEKSNLTLDDRLDMLGEEIEHQINRIETEQNKDLVEIIYMFYDQK